MFAIPNKSCPHLLKERKDAIKIKHLVLPQPSLQALKTRAEQNKAFNIQRQHITAHKVVQIQSTNVTKAILNKLEWHIVC